MITCGTEGGRSDVYFCFNRADYEAVATIAAAWRSEWAGGLSIDEGQATQSAIWVDSVRGALADAQVAIIFLGPNGISASQEMEIDEILPRWTRLELRTLVGILPECPKTVSAPERLQKARILDFRKESAESLSLLVESYCGEWQIRKSDSETGIDSETESDDAAAIDDADDLIRIEDVGEFMVDLRGMARRLLGGEKDCVSVRATALIMSALVRSKRQGQNWTSLTWRNREHFFSVMHREMRRSLIDHARKRSAMHRPKLSPTDPMDFDLYDLPKIANERPEVIIAMEEAIRWLEEFDNDMADHIKHHYFSGMTVSEMTSFFDVSEKTVKRKLSHARILLHERIEEILRDSGKPPLEGPSSQSEPPSDQETSPESQEAEGGVEDESGEDEDCGGLENPS